MRDEVCYEMHGKKSRQRPALALVHLSGIIKTGPSSPPRHFGFSFRTHHLAAVRLPQPGAHIRMPEGVVVVGPGISKQKEVSPFRTSSILSSLLPRPETPWLERSPTPTSSTPVSFFSHLPPPSSSPSLSLPPLSPPLLPLSSSPWLSIPSHFHSIFLARYLNRMGMGWCWGCP